MQEELDVIRANPAERLAPPEEDHPERKGQIFSWIIVGILAWLIFIV